jgi:hypothetical protein
MGIAAVPGFNPPQTIDHLRTIEMKEIKQKYARFYRSDAKRLSRRHGEIPSVLGNDELTSPDYRRCKHMLILGITSQTSFKSERNINHGFRERVSQLLSQTVDSPVVPAPQPQISLQFRQNPIRPVRAVHPVPSGFKQDIPKDGPEECACV